MRLSIPLFEKNRKFMLELKVFDLEQMADVQMMSYQKEKIVELDESVHQIGIQVIEGGHLNHAFSFYQTTFQLTAIEEHKTEVNVKVLYESAMEESTMPSKTTASALAYITSLENYLLHGAS